MLPDEAFYVGCDFLRSIQTPWGMSGRRYGGAEGDRPTVEERELS